MLKIFSVVDLRNNKTVDFFENKIEAKQERNKRNKVDGEEKNYFKVSHGPDYWRNK